MVLLAAAALVFVLRLGAGPLAFAGLSERLAEGLEARLGQGWTVNIADTSLTLLDRSVALKAAGVEIRNADGIMVARAPTAIVSVDTWSALRWTPQPRFVEFQDLQLKARVGKDGSLTLLPQGEGPPPAPAGPRPPPDPATQPRLEDALAAGTGAVLQPSGIIGALDRARFVNTRLTLVDEAGYERVGFERVDVDFERDAAGARLDALLRSPGGTWSLGVEARSAEGGGRRGSVTIREVPVDDLLLLGGLANLKGATNLKLSGEASLALRGDGALDGLEISVAGGPGRVALPNKGGDLPVDAVAAQAVWQGDRNAFAIRDLSFTGGATRLKLAGELAGAPGRGWRLDLRGADAVLSGAGPKDPPVALATVALAARGAPGEVTIEQLEVRGPEVDAAAAFSFGTAGDQGGVRFGVRGHGSNARAFLRLWPAMVGPTARTFLIGALRRGRVTSLAIDGVLSAEDIEGALAGRGMRDESLRVTFAGDGAELVVREGLPPIVDAALTGTATGRALSVLAPSGRLGGVGGRGLGLSDGRFTAPDMWPDAAVGRLALRLDGEADGLVAALNMPALRGDAGPAMDPAAVKGRADLRLDLALPIYDPPPMDDLALSINGRLSDIAVERVLGKERLEGASLAVAYENGGLVMKGDGRIGGTQAGIEVRQPKGAPGEAVVSMTLDEAARARRGMTLGSQLAGPVSVRVVAPLAKGPKGGPPRVEVDLTKAAIDDLVPGWTKPAGRPGRLSFSWSETAPDIRDLQIEAGALQIRGTATTGAEGALEKLDLATFKLSPGDDLRLQMERAGSVHRVTVRGNTADSRPFLRYLREPAAPARGGAASQSPGRDLDLDVQVNILTGHNDEALTRTSLKASVRGRELRDVEFNGRFTGAAVAGRTTRQNGAPLFMLQTGDAGATLRFLDLYGRMVGGDAQFQIGLGGARQAGALRLRNFVLRNEPALARIITQQPQSASAGQEASGNAPVAPLNASEVAFARARADFVRTGTRIDLRDTAISGAQVGFTLSGWYDPGRDALDIAGTFVPAYGLNNVFAQVPIIGPILGGGSNEGLFGVNFRVAGKASAPTLTVNPLSAIAPGIFRKLFGAGSSEPNAALPPLPER
ncbi:MAG TPA: DUF3971 domain-containing protein [Salinarimonas sp.]|nr:DUF3971 domain-containing protein [Salinarimonas sp.]